MSFMKSSVMKRMRYKISSLVWYHSMSFTKILSHEKDAIKGQFFREVSFYVVYENLQSLKGCDTRSVL